MSEHKVINIFTTLAPGETPVRVGTLWPQTRGAVFAYDEAWLHKPGAYELEPGLPLRSGSHYTQPGHALFGCMEDGSPDRWGTRLMQRQEAAVAQAQGRRPLRLSEVDFLLRVHDEARQGGLRYSVDGGLRFLNDDAAFAVPPLLSLERLMAAADRVCGKDEHLEDLQLLLAPGSSLGGAWPKACVRDAEGHLHIAKFSRSGRGDMYDVVSWEAVALELARRAGLYVSDSKLLTVGKRRVLLVRRFDRAGTYRMPYISAMTLLGAADNENHSYTELAEAVRQWGAEPVQSLRELWRRVAFSIMISNVDDHLRNHGFLRYNAKGWVLSPLFDINPVPPMLRRPVLSTALDGDYHVADMAFWRTLAPQFAIRREETDTLLREIAQSVACWRKAASSFGICQLEQNLLSGAFEHENGYAHFLR